MLVVGVRFTAFFLNICLFGKKIKELKKVDVFVHSNLISYSPAVGFPSGNFNYIATGTEDEIPQPLKPNMFGERRNRIVKIESWNSIEIHYYNRVGRLKLTYENGEVVELGKAHKYDEHYQSIELNGAYIKYVDVIANGPEAIDRIVFHFSDDRTFVVGEKLRQAKCAFATGRSFYLWHACGSRRF
ncbi:cell division protein FtsQ/DivIB [Vibrio parahaemolyticus]|uniref:cell division protein FtsQ/DivIB n=1 Tax=Vibrio parahaemolyticus TaxID=670 RepID=UPI001C5826C3|nr:cell division protein FtsQ/DivIB [Vibrio parahaemolyticus]